MALITNFLLGNLRSLSGFEISDVLKIDDKDYAITFSLYFRSVLFHIIELQKILQDRIHLKINIWQK